MPLHHPNADIFVPGGEPLAAALAKVTHLGIGTHQDDLEFMAFHGIMECHGRADRWFGGVVCTDGAGSARTGKYANCGDDEMRRIRIREQREAAVLGEYAAMLQLGYSSGDIKGSGAGALRDDLAYLLAMARPEIVYTHNPADKHASHVAVTIATLETLRRLPPEQRPRAVWGCEVWRDLDWLPDAAKVVLDVSGGESLAAALNHVFDSQIAGGKRYDLAIAGRRAANATFLDSHATDQASQVIFAMDLTPLVADPEASITDFVCQHIDRFKDDVRAKLAGW